VRKGLQRKSFFAVCGKKDWSGKPGFFARLRAKKCAQIPNYKQVFERALRKVFHSPSATSSASR
jgi:hypothetical protein